ncbi:hypothetical protein [Scytonema millei]|uniref:Uncharacterized protein n=1 Tax=Scytonema millei VB511283 TaxID=1245923 RepID=A0A9X5E7N4_9CYAN|nr:hypothetical protein [Scytonema millei]NHC36890.1 hypothetical protein [Scytonema millei VB511283]
MAKVRSPNYPGISLVEAVSKVQAVYDKEHRHPADKEVIAKSIGYGGINGASLTTISALLKYGLLESVGNQLRVTEKAETILLLSKGQSDRVNALREAAFAPDLFSELRDSFGDKLPSDENLRFSLVKKGFNPKTVDGVIRAYRDTIEFVNAEEALASDASDDEQKSSEIPIQTEIPMQPHVERSVSSSPSTNAKPPGANGNGKYASVEHSLFEETIVCRISQDCKARIHFDGLVTYEGIKKLIAYLELSADDYPKKDLQQLAADAQPQQLQLQMQDL